MEFIDKSSEVDKEDWEDRVRNPKLEISEESLSRLLAAEGWLISMILECEKTSAKNGSVIALLNGLQERSAPGTKLQAIKAQYDFAIEYLNAVARANAKRGVNARGGVIVILDGDPDKKNN